MKERNKRFRKWGLWFSILCASVFMNSVKVNAVEQKEVMTKLESVIYKYEGTTWHGGGNRSYVFAQFVFDEIFDRGSAAVANTVEFDGNTGSRLKNTAEDVATVGSLASGYSCAELERLLKVISPGDYMRVRKYADGGLHSMIVAGVDKEKKCVDILDADSDGRGTVKYYRQTFTEFKARNADVSVYRYSGHPGKLSVPEGWKDTENDTGISAFNLAVRSKIWRVSKRKYLQSGGLFLGLVSAAACFLHGKKIYMDEDMEEGESIGCNE